MWTAKLVSESKDRGVLSLGIELSNGVDDPFIEVFSVGSAPRSLADLVTPRLRQLEALDAFRSSLVMGPIGEKAPLPQTELDKQVFFGNYQKLQGLQALVDKGIILANAKDFTDLQVLVKSQYKASYFI